MALRLCAAWLLPLLVAVALQENCLAGWKLWWPACDAESDMNLGSPVKFILVPCLFGDVSQLRVKKRSKVAVLPQGLLGNPGTQHSIGRRRH